MQNIEKRLESIERNITRGNLITLLGIISFLRSKADDEESEKLLKTSGIMIALAMFLNGINDIVRKIGD